MEDEFNETLKILKQQKKCIMEEINNSNNIDEKNKYILNLTEIDEKIYQTYSYLENIKSKDLIKGNNKNDKMPIKNESNKKKKKIIKKINELNQYTSFKLNETQIKEIIKDNKKKSINYYDDTLGLKIKYVYKSAGKNFIY